MGLFHPRKILRTSPCAELHAGLSGGTADPCRREVLHLKGVTRKKLCRRDLTRLKHMYASYHKGRHFCSLDRPRTIPPVLDIFTARVIYLVPSSTHAARNAQNCISLSRPNLNLRCRGARQHVGMQKDQVIIEMKRRRDRREGS